MKPTPQLALSPLDGRYHQQTKTLGLLCSEFGLNKYRTQVELAWLQSLANNQQIEELAPFSDDQIIWLNELVDNFSLDDGETIKAIEQKTNHDVKAVEYFIKQKLETHPELHDAIEFIHFACTSEDINNLAYALMLKETKETILLPKLQSIFELLKNYANTYSAIPMLSRTHGQAASPTTVGKEFANVAVRLQKTIVQIEAVNISGKFNGATGNFNAHSIAYPEVDWQNHSKRFVESLGLHYAQYTTQIEPHDYIAELLNAMARANTILLDLSRDLWAYISLDYFKQKVTEGEVGSSTMPHKVNPIDFENAEGNLGLANAIMDHLARKLPISRWQRDLSDSTVLRNIGVGFAHSIIAYSSLNKGLNKLELNNAKLQADLNDNWEVLGEALQTVMRRYHIKEPYEKLKALTRGKKIGQQDLITFIDTLDLPQAVRKQLKQLTPATYLGLAKELASTLK